MLEIADIRYALSNNGDLLVHIPSRLGRNQGLDAAVHAMTISYGSYRNGERSQEALASYGAAILALKKCFDDPATALAPETLAAMYFCTIAQVCMTTNVGTRSIVLTRAQSFIADADDLNTTSAEAMAQIMKAAVRQPWQAGFDAEVLTLMCMPVVRSTRFIVYIN